MAGHTRALDSLHDVDGSTAELFVEVLDFTYTDAVFACTCPVEPDRAVHHIVNCLLDPLQLGVVVEQRQRVDIAISDVSAMSVDQIIRPRADAPKVAC
jgi:hypothetical protein